MLLGPDAWPSVTKATPLTLPLPATFTSARQWLVFWMRERAALVSGPSLKTSHEALLQHDDKGLIALNTDTLDVVFSVGGNGLWHRGSRPR